MQQLCQFMQHVVLIALLQQVIRPHQGAHGLPITLRHRIADTQSYGTVKLRTLSTALPVTDNKFSYHHCMDRPGIFDNTCGEGYSPGSWAKHPTGFTGAALPFTREAQKLIYDSQNPADCSKARFLVHRVGHSGIGSVLHGMAVGLSAAIGTNHVFVESKGTFLAEVPECGENKTLDSCYFLPFSHCKFDEAEAQGRITYISEPMIQKFRPAAPVLFAHLLNQTSINPKKYYWWWRAQLIAYIVRPNAQTLSKVEEKKRTTFRGEQLTPDCISLHIRHGDKGVESPVFEDAVYEERLNKLKQVAPSLSNQLFLSTEDPESIKYFTSRSQWKVSYTEVPRKPNRQQSNLSYMRQIGFYEEMINSLTNLDLAMECSGFVGSFYSNWVRLIDELRSTVRCRADKPYVDSFQGYADDPSSIDTNW